MLCVTRKNWLIGAIGAVVLVLAIPVSLASPADDYHEQARERVAAGEIKAAIIELKNALQADPSHVESRVLLGSLYLRSADGPAAAKEFGRARELGAPAELWIEGLARALTLQGEFRQVLDRVRPADDLDIELRAELLALRGNAHLALRERDDANREFDAALALQSGNATARLGKAQIMLVDRREDEALEQLNLVLQENPGHVESRLVRGDLLRRLQRMDEAGVDYARAAEEAPNNPRAHIGLALVHISKSDTEAAKKNLAKLRGITRGLPAVSYLQALVSFQERDLERASDELQVLLRAAPSNLQAQLLYGIVSYAREEYTIADDYLTRVMASTPGNPQVIKLLGATRLKLRQPDRALSVLASGVTDETQDAQLLAMLGTAYIQSGDNSKGSEYIARAVELDPDQALLRTQLAVGKIATGDTTGAISQLESAVALGQDVIQADVLLVLSYLNKKDYDKAIAASEALERRMQDSPIPYNLTGLAYLAQRQFDDARERFNLALEKDDKFVVARMNLARLALVENKLDDARRAYEAVLAVQPKHLGALLGMSALASAAGDNGGAERWLLRANEANPNALQPVAILAEGYLRRNEGLKALNMLSGLSAKQAALPQVLRLKGMAQLQTGDYGSAVDSLSRLTEVQPNGVEGWFQLARAQAAGGDAAASRASFRRATELDKEFRLPVVWIGLGELELREKRYEEALAVAEIVKERFAKTVFGYDLAAAAYRGMGDIEKALVEGRAAMEIDKTPSRVDGMARMLAGVGRLEDAVTMLNGWLETHPDDGPRWSKLGLIQQQMGRDDAALHAYEKSLEFSEPSAVQANNMAWLYLDKNGERAIELATKAYELEPSRAEIVDTYGWVLFRHGRKSDGLAALQQAMIIAPRNPEITLHVAEALHEMRRDGEARPILERILRDHPNTDFAKDAKLLLGKLRG